MPENDQLAIAQTARLIGDDQFKLMLNWTKMDQNGKKRVLEIANDKTYGYEVIEGDLKDCDQVILLTYADYISLENLHYALWASKYYPDIEYIFNYNMTHDPIYTSGNFYRHDILALPPISSSPPEKVHIEKSVL